MQTCLLLVRLMLSHSQPRCCELYEGAGMNTSWLGLIHSDNYWAALILLVLAIITFVLQNRTGNKAGDE
jgi:predicted small integral membrane protein